MKIQKGKRKELRIDDEGVLRHGDRIWVPEANGLRKEVMKEAHYSAYSIHPGGTKMYKDLK